MKPHKTMLTSVASDSKRLTLEYIVYCDSCGEKVRVRIPVSAIKQNRAVEMIAKAWESIPSCCDEALKLRIVREIQDS
jgi:hypothetical protein